MRKRLLLAALMLPLIAGCTSLLMGGSYEKKRQGASSSLVDFLYPDSEVPPTVDDQMPSLALPLRVGIAFVPTHQPEDISAAEKQVLMERVAGAFRDRPYVASIDTIPDTYMRSAKGIHGMQQVAALYDIDVMALVSYDQVSFSGERDSSLLYWTVIGAVIVKGNTNEVQSLIDTAVFDASTAKLLFRAPGTHNAQSNATLVDSDRELRRLRSDGFMAATDDMIVNLDTELTGFRAAVENGERAEVAWRDGTGGGGGLAIPYLAVLLLVGVMRNIKCRRS